jgi:4,5-dihydroxyphthalate decarboxylase
MLDAKEISAIISAERPDSFVDKNSSVRRLFPDYPKIEKEYFERTGIFPIMHTVVIRREIYEKNRWIAQSVYQGFERAKEVGSERLRYTGALYASIPWLGHHLEELDLLTAGIDMFQYGLSANRSVLETFLGYSSEQGLIDAVPAVEDLFAPETRGT